MACQHEGSMKRLGVGHSTRRLLRGFAAGLVAIVAAGVWTSAGPGSAGAAPFDFVVTFTPSKGRVGRSWTVDFSQFNADNTLVQVNCISGTEFVDWDSPAP